MFLREVCIIFLISKKFIAYIYETLLIVILFAWSTQLFGEMSHLSSYMFFDAERSSLDREGTVHNFDGHVIAIAEKILISADKVKIDQKNQRITAEGHIIVLASNQIITGSSLVLNTVTNEFSLHDSAIINQDDDLKREFLNKILGFTQNELNFEVSRQNRLNEIEMQKSSLRTQYRSLYLKGRVDLKEIIDKYTILLEKEELIKKQTNSSFTRMSQSQKESFIKRREFWDKNRNLSFNQQINQMSYFKIEGNEVRKKTEGRFEANRAFFTPCMCTDDENPAWGFWAEKIEGQVGGYANLYHSVIKIKSIPIFYIPALKIPLKKKRQSGFLFPSISHSNTNGSMFSQSIFYAFNKARDATFTLDSIEKRGLRFGLEYREQLRQYSGWELQLDGIRDKLWLDRQQRRINLSENYSLGLERAKQFVENNPEWSNGLPEDHLEFQSISDPGWWNTNNLSRCLNGETSRQCSENEINNALKLPENTWRGKFKWKGQSILAPRLTFISHGKLLSDHRYEQDLWVPQITDFYSPAPSDLYSVSRSQFHLDGQNFYAGIGSHIADPVLALKRYSGYQIPMNFKFQPRILQLTDSSFRFPLYLQLDYDLKNIKTFRESTFSSTLPKNQILRRLGNGNVQRSKADLISPINNDGIFQSDFFSSFEYRSTDENQIHSIYHDLSKQAENNLPDNHLGPSFLHTLNSGIHFSLPMDGRMITNNPLPNLTLTDKNNTSTILEHFMNWDVTFSIRSHVSKRGDYGKSYEYLEYDETSNQWKDVTGSRHLSYYANDRSLEPNKKITFSTNHDWYTYEEKWQQQSPNLSQLTNQSHSTFTYKEKAEQELLYSLDKPVKGHHEMFDTNGNLSTNRYRLSKLNFTNPIHLDSNISFDYSLLEKRNEYREKNKRYKLNLELPQPWSPIETNIRFSWKGVTLQTENQFNLYSKIITNMNFSLSFPSFYQSTIGLTYNIHNSPYKTDSGKFKAKTTHTKVANFSTNIIPHYSISISGGIKTYETSTQYSSGISLSYASPGKCWGYNTGWSREFEDSDWNGFYYLGLVVNFYGYSRTFGNMLTKINQAS